MIALFVLALTIHDLSVPFESASIEKLTCGYKLIYIIAVSFTEIHRSSSQVGTTQITRDSYLLRHIVEKSSRKT